MPRTSCAARSSFQPGPWPTAGPRRPADASRSGSVGSDCRTTPRSPSTASRSLARTGSRDSRPRAAWRQEPKTGSAIGSTIAKGTGNVLLDVISGGATPQGVARAAGQAALNHQEPQAASSGEVVLLLDSGVVFDIFVEKAF